MLKKGTGYGHAEIDIHELPRVQVKKKKGRKGSVILDRTRVGEAEANVADASANFD